MEAVKCYLIFTAFLIIFFYFIKEGVAMDDDDDELVSRMIGGTDVIKAKVVANFKFVASVWHKNVSFERADKERFTGQYGHMCSANIITQQYSITAAVCLHYQYIEKKYKMKVIQTVIRAGYMNGWNCTQDRDIDHILFHPRFTLDDLSANIAIVKVTQNFDFNMFVGRIGFYMAGYITCWCTVVGWGDGPTEEEAVRLGGILKYFYVYVLREGGDYFPVQRVHVPSPHANFSNQYNPNCNGELPTYFEGGMCEGDQGGPLDCNGKLAGLNVEGYACCNPDNYDKYINLQKFLPWMKMIGELPPQFFM